MWSLDDSSDDDDDDDDGDDDRDDKVIDQQQFPWRSISCSPIHELQIIREIQL
jgi:hypothetical protein